MPDPFVVCPVDDLPPGEAVRVLAPDGTAIAVFNVDGELFAIDDTCTHQNASLSEGWVEDCAVECPLHSSMFDLRTGEPSGLPAITPVRTHAVEVRDGAVVVDVSAKVR